MAYKALCDLVFAFFSNLIFFNPLPSLFYQSYAGLLILKHAQFILASGPLYLFFTPSETSLLNVTSLKNPSLTTLYKPSPFSQSLFSTQILCLSSFFPHCSMSSIFHFYVPRAQHGCVTCSKCSINSFGWMDRYIGGRKEGREGGRKEGRKEGHPGSAFNREREYEKISMCLRK